MDSNRRYGWLGCMLSLAKVIGSLVIGSRLGDMSARYEPADSGLHTGVRQVAGYR